MDRPVREDALTLGYAAWLTYITRHDYIPPIMTVLAAVSYTTLTLPTNYTV